MGSHNMGKQSHVGVSNRSEVRAATQQLMDLRSDMLKLEVHFSLRTRELCANQRNSAANLIHYLALRSHDLRQLQKRLSDLGVSSLNRSEGRILEDVDLVLGVLRRLQHSQPAPRSRGHRSASILDRNTDVLLGPKPDGRNVRIMVTAPVEAATDHELIHRLLQHGMNCLRINCAYGTPEEWGLTIANLRQAQAELGKPCSLLMDIAGPKLHIGSIAPGPPVIKIRPRRDAFGQVVKPARVWITPAENRVQPPGDADGCLFFPEHW